MSETKHFTISCFPNDVYWQNCLSFLQKKGEKKRKENILIFCKSIVYSTILTICYTYTFIFSRFQLYYYADAEFKKEERKDTILTIDTRSKQGMRIESNYDEDGDLDDDRKEPPLQLAIKTK